MFPPAAAAALTPKWRSPSDEANLSVYSHTLNYNVRRARFVLIAISPVATVVVVVVGGAVETDNGLKTGVMRIQKCRVSEHPSEGPRCLVLELVRRGNVFVVRSRSSHLALRLDSIFRLNEMRRSSCRAGTVFGCRKRR